MKMKRLKTTLALILVILLLGVGRTSYATLGSENSDHWGKHTADTELKSEGRESLIFGIDDDITLNISFGGEFSCVKTEEGIKIDEEKEPPIHAVRLVLRNDSGKELCIRYLEDDYVSAKYRKWRTNDSNYVYAHTEEIVIPNSMLDKNSGSIYFSVMGILDGEETESELSKECICYKKSDTEIQISEGDVANHTEVFVNSYDLCTQTEHHEVLGSAIGPTAVNPHFNRYIFSKIECCDIRDDGAILLCFKENDKTVVMSYHYKTKAYKDKSPLFGRAYVETFNYSGPCVVEWPNINGADIYKDRECTYWVHFPELGVSRFAARQYSICESAGNRETLNKLLSRKGESDNGEYLYVGNAFVFGEDFGIIYPSPIFIIPIVLLLAIIVTVTVLIIVRVKKRRRGKA